MTTVEAIREDRERREAVAAERASKLKPGGDYYASGKAVIERTHGYPVAVYCESHWDACLVLLAIPKIEGKAE